MHSSHDVVTEAAMLSPIQSVLQRRVKLKPAFDSYILPPLSGQPVEGIGVALGAAGLCVDADGVPAAIEEALAWST